MAKSFIASKLARHASAAAGIAMAALEVGACETGHATESPPSGTTGCKLTCDKLWDRCGIDEGECLARCHEIISLANNPAECGEVYDGLIACEINADAAWPSCGDDAGADAGAEVEAGVVSECGKQFDFGSACLNR